MPWQHALNQIEFLLNSFEALAIVTRKSSQFLGVAAILKIVKVFAAATRYAFISLCNVLWKYPNIFLKYVPFH